ncbi:hypothetical protein [Nocardia bhagyanarayanae]|uniref:Uncharacterized protein n=1 Tax=Nocardia bhagyanarayanae TaxID=1215925 RepID=A0A543FFU4_9NOCA|nr:hypothetical protein [Nocardia bhagyanarayanae]TQM32738.1 hypothetical protein FB390_4434 [Nocardia bhagyanarayanae]
MNHRESDCFAWPPPTLLRCWRAKRVIRISADLLAVVHEALATIEHELPSHCELLWDRTPGVRRRNKKAGTDADKQDVADVWRPKPEAALSAYIAHELTLRLAGDRIAVNREVLILPTDPYGAGDRTDILIDTHTHADDVVDADPGHPIKLVIEVKGAWNVEVETAQETQLVQRYLPETDTDIGIYVVGWYPIGLWDAKADSRKTQAKKLDPDTLSGDLKAQAQRWSNESAVHVESVVMTIPRPYRPGVGQEATKPDESDDQDQQET